MDATTTTTARGTSSLARVAVWLLPVHAALLAIGSITHQPDPGSDFGGYAGYVTTGTFLVSHLVASILGAALGAVGAVGVLAFLHRGAGGRLAAWGAACTIAGNVVTTAVFGSAAFAQPAIGRAFRRGTPDVPAIDTDVYGAPLVGTAVVGLLLLMAGGICLGLAVRRGASGLRGVGAAYAVLLVVFAVGGFVVPQVQPVAALGLTVAAVLIALRLPRATGHDVGTGAPINPSR